MDKKDYSLPLAKAEFLLCLDVLAYFPEFSHQKYDTVGEFVSYYLSLPQKKRPVTMFGGFCSDERSGVTALMKRISRCERLTKLPIVYSSVGSERYTSVCVSEDTIGGSGELSRRDICIIIGCNYRFGEYISDHGRTSTWRDNFLGAVQTETAEQKSILRFYDEAVKEALSDKRITADTVITITVSGHSKAGNLAQYITIMRDNADCCYSFDGQGFSDSFMKKYASRISERGRRIINILPDMSIAGSLLNPIPTAKTVYIGTGFMREKGAAKNPLYYHIPISVLDKNGKMRRTVKSMTSLSRLLHRVSLLSVGISKRLPFIDEERGLGDIGSALMHFFKGRPRKALRSLLCGDPLFVLAVGAMATLLLFPAAVVGTLTDNKECGKLS